MVGPSFFEMLGLQAAHGRTFRAQDVEGAGAGNVFVLSHYAWQRHFAGDPSIVGQTVRLNDQPFTILGVTPEDFHGTMGILEADGFVPLSGAELIDPSYKEIIEDRASDSFRVIAKLQPGVSLAEARAAVTVQASRPGPRVPGGQPGPDRARPPRADGPHGAGGGGLPAADRHGLHGPRGPRARSSPAPTWPT